MVGKKRFIELPACGRVLYIKLCTTSNEWFLYHVLLNSLPPGTKLLMIVVMFVVMIDLYVYPALYWFAVESFRKKLAQISLG